MEFPHTKCMKMKLKYVEIWYSNIKWKKICYDEKIKVYAKRNKEREGE